MATIAKYRGSWSVRWRDPNGKARRRKCPDKRTAEALQRDIERAHALGRRWEPTETRPPARLGEAVNAYIDERAQTYADGTLLRAAESLGYAQECWGRDLPLSELTKTHLHSLWSWMRDPATARHGKQRSLDTCRKHIGSVQTFWTWLADHDLYASETPHPRRIQVKRDPPKLPSAPTWAQCDQMIAECRSEWTRRVAVLARFTGARSRELLRLEWSDLDMEAGTIRWRPETTKGGYGGRDVPMPPALRDEMAGWGKRSGLVCQPPPGAEGHMRDKLGHAWKRAGVSERVWKGQPTHAFRKALETELRTRGVPPEVLNVYIGHKDSSVAGRHYADQRWAWDLMVEAVDRIPAVDVSPACPRVVGIAND